MLLQGLHSGLADIVKSGMQGLQGVGDAEVLPAVVIVEGVHGSYLSCAFALDGGLLRGFVLLSTHETAITSQVLRRFLV